MAKLPLLKLPLFENLLSFVICVWMYGTIHDRTRSSKFETHFRICDIHSHRIPCLGISRFGSHFWWSLHCLVDLNMQAYHTSTPARITVDTCRSKPETMMKCLPFILRAANQSFHVPEKWKHSHIFQRIWWWDMTKAIRVCASAWKTFLALWRFCLCWLISCV